MKESALDVLKPSLTQTGFPSRRPGPGREAARGARRGPQNRRPWPSAPDGGAGRGGEAGAGGARQGVGAWSPEEEEEGASDADDSDVDDKLGAKRRKTAAEAIEPREIIKQFFKDHPPMVQV